jgi:hypothetical protein
MRLFIRPYVAPIRPSAPISYGRIEAHSMRLFIRPYVAPIRPSAPFTPTPCNRQYIVRNNEIMLQ